MTKEALRIAAGYIRVSTEDQTEYSPNAQRKALAQYATGNNMILDERYIYVDEGISGRKAEKRPAFMEMIAAAKLKPAPFDVILVHKFDRFARSREDSVVYKSMLKRECGISVISIAERIEDDKFSVILEAMLEAMAEYYSINLSDEVKKGMTEKAQRGGLQATPAFGYRVEDNRLVPVPEEAALIREIFSRFLAGEGYYPIARWLNGLGIRTHRGNSWENRTVEYILRNPVYIGKLRWNPNGRTQRDFTNENIILADGNHKPLIDIDTWNATQTRAAEVKARWRYKGRPSSVRHDWLSGIVRCPNCGATLVYSAPCYFKCGNYAKGRCQTSQHVHVDILHKAFLDRLRSDMVSSAPLKVTISRATDGTKDEIGLLRQQLEQITRRVNRLRDAYLAGAEPVEAYKAMKQAMDENISALQTELERLRSKNNAADAEVHLQEQIKTVLKTLQSPDIDLSRKFESANSIVKTSMWDKSKRLLSITYRYIF